MSLITKNPSSLVNDSKSCVEEGCLDYDSDYRFSWSHHLFISIVVWFSYARFAMWTWSRSYTLMSNCDFWRNLIFFSFSSPPNVRTELTILGEREWCVQDFSQFWTVRTDWGFWRSWVCDLTFCFHSVSLIHLLLGLRSHLLLPIPTLLINCSLNCALFTFGEVVFS